MKQQQIWDALAESWNRHRQKPVKEAVYFSQSWKPGNILDIGCGNCRNLLPFAQNKFKCYGIDFSKSMIEEAKKYIKKHSVKVILKKASIEKLPFKDKTFDYMVSFAAFHHLETKEKRKKALQEMKRVLKENGLIVISVWNKLQPKFIFSRQDVFMPWKIKGKTYYRYYHLFTHRELEKLLKEENFKIIKSNTFGNNLTFLLTKK